MRFESPSNANLTTTVHREIGVRIGRRVVTQYPIRISVRDVRAGASRTASKTGAIEPAKDARPLIGTHRLRHADRRIGRSNRVPQRIAKGIDASALFPARPSACAPFSKICHRLRFGDLVIFGVEVPFQP